MKALTFIFIVSLALAITVGNIYDRYPELKEDLSFREIMEVVGPGYEKDAYRVE